MMDEKAKQEITTLRLLNLKLNREKRLEAKLRRFRFEEKLMEFVEDSKAEMGERIKAAELLSTVSGWKNDKKAKPRKMGYHPRPNHRHKMNPKVKVEEYTYGEESAAGPGNTRQ